MPTYISFEMNNTTHYVSFNEDFTELSQVSDNTTATLSPTTVNNIEFNAENTFSSGDNTMLTADMGFGSFTYYLFLNSPNGSDSLILKQDNQGNEAEASINNIGQVPAQIHDGTPPVTAGASGDPFITPLL